MNRQETVDFLIERSHSPLHRGRLDAADVVMPGGNPSCGDVVTIYLRVNRERDTVDAVSFEGDGCTISQAAASVLAEMVQGSPLAGIEAMDYNEMTDALGREIVRSRPRCATLALSTLKAAVKRYRQAQTRERSGEGPATEGTAARAADEAAESSGQRV
ncbi:MAG: iron-sulfur cluster assembly scaffold protein [Acidobacteriia bacterium]|nr:iron-sulfur cluster assembly scaffold protein [Terriglobia bacterium]